jgi:pyruvate kinase
MTQHGSHTEERLRKTKIICTIGPATSSREILGRLIDAGMNIARLNMSHAPHDWLRQVVAELRAAAKERQAPLAILLDTQGPAIRTGDLPTDLKLEPGQKFTLTVKGATSEEGNSVDVNYENFINDISVGDVVLVDNGTIRMKVLTKFEHKIECKVLTEGTLRSRRHINLPGVKVSLPALTEKDLKDVQIGMELGVGLVALSFVREAKDLRRLKAIMGRHGRHPPVIAKIEDRQAVDNIDEIIEAWTSRRSPETASSARSLPSSQYATRRSVPSSPCSGLSVSPYMSGT